MLPIHYYPETVRYHRSPLLICNACWSFTSFHHIYPKNVWHFKLINTCHNIPLCILRFTVQLHLMQCKVLPGESHLSICLSNAWIVTKRKVVLPIFIYHIKDHSSKFSDKKNGWWGATPTTWNFRPNWPRWSKNADCQSTLARSTSAITPSEKVYM